ncbi:MAG: M56 family metallopeptidase [Gemmatimonadota bacterium]
MNATAFLVDIAVKAMLILGGAALVTAALRGASAATRHLAWTLALVAVAALPLMKLGLPTWSPPGSGLLPVAGAAAAGEIAADGAFAGDLAGERAAPSTTIAVVDEASPVALDGSAEGAMTALHGPAAGSRPARESSARPDPAAAAAAAGLPWSSLLLALGVSGVLLAVGRAVAGVRSVRLAEARCRRLPSGPVRAEATRLTREAGIPAPRLLQSPDDLMPMAWGVLRPTIALPAAAAEWHPRRLRAVVRHEIAHLRRRDPLSQWVADAVRALHWFNPLAWLAVNRLRAERELACDDEVLARTARPSEYAAELVGVARTMKSARLSAALPMARSSQLAERVRAALDGERSRSRLQRGWVAGAAIVSALLVGPVAAAAPEGAIDQVVPESTIVPAAAPAEGTERAAREPVAGAPAGRTVAPDGGVELEPIARIAACWDGDWSGSRSRNSNDDDHRLKWRSGDCELDMRIEGEVRFTRDLDGLEYLGPTARFRVREDDGDVRRELEASPDLNGGPVYSFSMDGREAPFDAEARRWFAGIVLALARNSDFGAEQRVANLLESGGVGAVLREIEILGSGWVRWVYFRELADQAALDAEEVERGLRLAGRLIDSDHYLAETAGVLVAEGPLAAGARDALVASVETIDSDHYRTQVLARALDGGALGPRTLPTLLEAVGRVDSDHYKAEILVDAVDAYEFDRAQQEAYVDIARAMDSDHYRAKVLNALLDAGGEGVAGAVTMAATEGMESDHYRAEILGRIVAGGLHSVEEQRLFVRTIADLDSDHYRAELLSELIDASAGDQEQIATVIVAARSIDSDHYMAETLIAVAERVRLEGALREAFEETMSQIDSETYYGRVSRHLNR